MNNISKFQRTIELIDNLELSEKKKMYIVHGANVKDLIIILHNQLS